MIGNLLAAILVSASIDSTQMVMGEQTDMHVQVTHPAEVSLQALDFSEQLPAGIEAVRHGAIDTIALSDGQIQLSQHLVLTGFADSTFAIRPYAVTANGDTVSAQTQYLTILKPEGVDEMEDIFDIKAIENVPVWWWDVVKWIVLAIGCLLLALGGYYIWLWYVRTHQRPSDVPVKPVYTRPADIDALEQLDAIRDAKIWQKGQTKQYHTELTDVVRTYIGRRFDVHSTEKTSNETLRELKPILLKGEGLQVTGDGKDLYAKLSKMLQLADFVKFAKYEAMPDENESALTTAYDFVNETKIPTEQTVNE